MAFKEYMASFILVGLFFLCMVTFVNQYQAENGVATTLLDDPQIANITGNLNQTLENVQTIAQQQRESFEDDSPLVDFGQFIFTTITGVTRIFTGVIVGFVNIFAQIAIAVGISPIVVSVVIGVIVIYGLLLGWRLYRTGD